MFTFKIKDVKYIKLKTVSNSVKILQNEWQKKFTHPRRRSETKNECPLNIFIGDKCCYILKIISPNLVVTKDTWKARNSNLNIIFEK